jgi:two-component system NtrC family sensor kinase
LGWAAPARAIFSPAKTWNCSSRWLVTSAIAIQNAQLYRRLEQKIFDFERLRDFNENIVESINIGVFAVDLQDCIESWNAQMEVMYATPRAEALRRP